MTGRLQVTPDPALPFRQVAGPHLLPGDSPAGWRGGQPQPEVTAPESGGALARGPGGTSQPGPRPGWLVWQGLRQRHQEEESDITWCSTGNSNRHFADGWTSGPGRWHPEGWDCPTGPGRALEDGGHGHGDMLSHLSWWGVPWPCCACPACPPRPPPVGLGADKWPIQSDPEVAATPSCEQSSGYISPGQPRGSTRCLAASFRPVSGASTLFLLLTKNADFIVNLFLYWFAAEGWF